MDGDAEGLDGSQEALQAEGDMWKVRKGGVPREIWVLLEDVIHCEV